MKSQTFPHNHLIAAALGSVWFASIAGLGYIWIQTLNTY